MVAQGVGLNHFHRFKLLKPCLLGDFILPFIGIVLQVSYIGNVAHIAHLVAEMAEELAEHVIGHSRAGVPEVCLTIDCRAADVHSDVARVYGDKDFLAVGKSIC